MRYTNRRVLTQGSAFRGLEHNILRLHPQTFQKNHMATHTIWQIHNLHNCMIHKDTMLKFCRLFDLAKYLGHTLTFQRMGYGRELVAPTLNFGTSSLSRKLIELGS